MRNRSWQKNIHVISWAIPNHKHSLQKQVRHSTTKDKTILFCKANLSFKKLSKLTKWFMAAFKFPYWAFWWVVELKRSSYDQVMAVFSKQLKWISAPGKSYLTNFDLRSDLTNHTAFCMLQPVLCSTVYPDGKNRMVGVCRVTNFAI